MRYLKQLEVRRGPAESPNTTKNRLTDVERKLLKVALRGDSLIAGGDGSGDGGSGDGDGCGGGGGGGSCGTASIVAAHLNGAGGPAVGDGSSRGGGGAGSGGAEADASVQLLEPPCDRYGFIHDAGTAGEQTTVIHSS